MRQEKITSEQATPLRVRAFEQSDWDWMQKWFEDEVLNSRLGPVDETWVEYVLADTDGAQLVVELPDGAAVALVGVAWDRAGRVHCITDIAVDPRRRRCRIGGAALSVVMAWRGHPPVDTWIAFVDPENSPASTFFSSIGWTWDGIDDGMHRFHVQAEAAEESAAAAEPRVEGECHVYAVAVRGLGPDQVGTTVAQIDSGTLNRP